MHKASNTTTTTGKFPKNRS
ncbi:unnamed protein product, partial [Rotaria sp. Silwood2]